MKNLLGTAPLSQKIDSFEEHSRLMKEVGFDATLFDWSETADIATLIGICEKDGLYVDNFHAPFGGLNCIWYEGKAGDEYAKRLENCAIDAGKYGVKNIIVHCTAGRNKEPDSEPHASRIGMERFKRLIDTACSCGVKVCFENLEYPEVLGVVMDYFKNEDIGFCFDTGHEALCTPGMRFIPLYGDKLTCTHIHDNYGASYSKVPIVHGDCHMLPFDGALDFTRIMADIRSTGYTGVLMLEAGARSDLGTYYDLSAREYYERGFAALRKLSEM